jgi:hypothetical protein
LTELYVRLTERAKLDAELKANESLLEDIATKQVDLAKIAVEKWYKDEREKINNGQQYTVTKQENESRNNVSLEDKLWKAVNLPGDVFYLFKNGQLINNELEYESNGLKQTVTWHYLLNQQQIQINLSNFSETYSDIFIFASRNSYLQLKPTFCLKS